jgi:galactonate dehydratase
MGGAVRQKIKAYANGWYPVERRPEEFAVTKDTLLHPA